MNRERNDMADISGKKISTKHISMELTADGARVTNLSLAGSRLILTIEAELADSQVRATEPSQAQSAAATGRSGGFAAADSSRLAPRGDSRDLDRTKNDRTETEFVLRPATHPAPSSPAGIGFGDSEDVMGGLPADPFQNRPGASEAMRPAGDPAPLENTRLREITANSISFGPDTGISGPGEFAFEHGSPLPPPAAPALEPVREFAKTWPVPGGEPVTGISLNAGAGIPAPAMAPPAPTPLPPAPAPTLALGGAPVPAAPRPAPEVLPAMPAPLAAQPLMLGDAPPAPAPGIGMAPAPIAVPSPAPAPAAPAPALNAPLPGGWNADGISSLNLASMEIAPVPQPQMETWDPSAMSTLPAMAEDSSAVGGERHGEPQPAISFGDAPAAPAPIAPAPAAPTLSLNSPAPSPAVPARPLNSPAPAPIAMNPPGGIPPLAMNAPGMSAPISLGGAPAPAMGASVAAGLAMSPAAAPAPSLGMEPAPIAPPPATPAPIPSFAPTPEAAGISLEPQSPPPPVPQDLPTVQGPFPARSDAGARPAMELQEPAPEEKKEPEAGGTTVLIRYTCPKCKTQGMQAVDKVGTVVNCSNCGKAMRLVMKK